MPARKVKIRHDEETRAKIQVAQIINRLQAGFRGEIELSQVQVSIANMLLRKVLPDLTAAENKTEVLHRYVARVPDKSLDAETWQQQHSPTTH